LHYQASDGQQTSNVATVELIVPPSAPPTDHDSPEDDNSGGSGSDQPGLPSLPSAPPPPIPATEPAPPASPPLPVPNGTADVSEFRGDRDGETDTTPIAAGDDWRTVSYGSQYQRTGLAGSLQGSTGTGVSSLRATTGLVDAGTILASMQDDLDRVNEEMLGRISVATGQVAAAASLTGAFTVGYVLWMARGGMLFASLMSSMPAWRSFDPLPILQYATRDEDDGDDDSLQSLVAD
jgi:hypothetical protein